MAQSLGRVVVCAVLAAGVLPGGIQSVLAAEKAPLQQRLEHAEELIQQLQREVEQLKREEPEAAGRLAPLTEPSADTVRVYWKKGLRAETKDKKFTVQIGGRIQNDWAAGTVRSNLAQTIGADFKNGTEFRRARLFIAGTMYGDFIYKAQWDFEDGVADFKDMYLGLRKVPGIGTIRVGHFKEPFSLEELTSSKYITFMERSLPNAFSSGRSTGVGIHNTMADGRMTWAAGMFLDTDAFGEEKVEEEFAAAARVTALPVYADGGRTLLHVGASYRFEQPESETASFSARPEMHLAPSFVSTGSFPADSMISTGAEVAVVAGPLSVQSEYLYTYIDGPGGADPHFQGLYAYVSFFLTGENRPYKASSGAFGSVKPTQNFSVADGSSGAWEVAARYSEVDLTDDQEGISGGKLRDVTTGVNWYLNPNVRVMANWVRSEREGKGTADLFGGRFQIFF